MKLLILCLLIGFNARAQDHYLEHQLDIIYEYQDEIDYDSPLGAYDLCYEWFREDMYQEPLPQDVEYACHFVLYDY